MRHAERLPGKAESRRPEDAVGALERVFLIGQDRLIVRLLGVVAE